MLVDVTERGNLTFTRSERDVTQTRLPVGISSQMQLPLAFVSLALPPPHTRTHTLTHTPYLICVPSPVPLLVVPTAPICLLTILVDYKLKTLPPVFSCEQMSTKEKLISHVMKEQPIGCQNKVTVVGVGMVGMASAISILLKVRGSTSTWRWRRERG